MKALLVIDMQNEWLDQNSDYYVEALNAAKVNALIAQCRAAGYKIFFTRHVEEDAESAEDAFWEGGNGAKLISSLERQESDKVITKNRISPFYDTDLDDDLEEIDDIVVCGVLTNLCVRQTIEEAYDRDFNIVVVADCCFAMDEATQEFTIEDLETTREEVVFVDLSDFDPAKSADAYDEGDQDAEERTAGSPAPTEGGQVQQQPAPDVQSDTQQKFI